jgi:HEAT repeat protein
MNYFRPIISKINLITALLLFFCFSGLIFAEPNKPDENLGGQSKINRWTLFNSTDEQIRIDTAVELLKNPSSEARQILLEALGASDNAGAQASVCKALRQFRSFSQLIPDKEDFIVPLMDIIRGQNMEVARLAAQASLIFTYRQIKNQIEDTAENSALSVVARKNAIYALQIYPDKEAVSELIRLLDDDNEEIASAAAAALQEWLPAIRDKKLWRKTLKDFEGKSRTDILRERLLTQEQKIEGLSDEVSLWQKKYILSLDNIYQATTDENVRGKFIAENLAFAHSSVKLWAIEKINMWRKSGKSLPIEVFQKPLVTLVSDSDPAVRLATTKLLGILTNVNSADALFVQLKIETQSDVKTEILVALAHVCNFALSPGAEVKINPEIRIQTLQIASEYLKDSNPVAAAEVIRNLLLQNGLEVQKVKPYFELIADCFRKADAEQVKSRLLEEMVRLCGSDSFYRTTAGETFADIFKQAVDDANSQIATPAVVGFVKVDQAGAFELLKQKGFTNHPSAKIRSELISAAGQIGTIDDLEWLGPMVITAGVDDERKQAADAMMNIFQYCKADVLLGWAQKFARQAKTKSDEFILARTRILFETAEKKVEAEQNTQLLFSVRFAMANFCNESAIYDLAAKYYGILLQSNPDPNKASDITARLLDVHLHSGQIESATQIVANFLLTADLSPKAEITGVLDNYFTANQNSEQAGEAFSALASINISDQNPRPFWSRQLEIWKTLVKITSRTSVEPNVPAESNAPAEPNTSTL